MEVQKDVTNGKVGLFRSILSLTTRIFLDLADFASISACFWTIFCLLYLCFLKDFVEIITYAALKYTKRFKWLYKLTKLDKLIHIESLQKISPSHSSKIVKDNFQVDEVFEGSPGILDITSNSKSGNLSKCSPVTPTSSVCKLMINPRRIDMNPADKCKRDVAYVSPVQQSYFKRKIFSWNFDKIRFSDSFRSQEYSSLSSPNASKVNSTCYETKFREVQPVPCDDKGKLINDDSPDRIGCCNNIFAFLKSRFQAEQTTPCSMHYKRF